MSFVEQLPLLRDLRDNSGGNNKQYRRQLLAEGGGGHVISQVLLEAVYNINENEQLAAVLKPAEKRYFRRHRVVLRKLTSSKTPVKSKLKYLARLGLVFLKRLIVAIERYFSGN